MRWKETLLRVVHRYIAPCLSHYFEARIDINWEFLSGNEKRCFSPADVVSFEMFFSLIANFRNDNANRCLFVFYIVEEIVDFDCS